MNLLQTAGCRRQKGLPPGDVGGDGAAPQGTKPGWPWGGWRLQSDSPGVEPLRCPNAPGSAALAQPSPVIGWETRNGTDRAGWAPQDCLLSAQTPALGYLPQARLLPCPPPRSSLAVSLARPRSSGLQTLVFFLIRQAARPLTVMVTVFPSQRGHPRPPAPPAFTSDAGGAESSSPRGHPHPCSFVAHFTDDSKGTDVGSCSALPDARNSLPPTSKLQPGRWGPEEAAPMEELM